MAKVQLFISCNYYWSMINKPFRIDKYPANFSNYSTKITLGFIHRKIRGLYIFSKLSKHKFCKTFTVFIIISCLIFVSNKSLVSASGGSKTNDYIVNNSTIPIQVISASSAPPTSTIIHYAQRTAASDSNNVTYKDIFLTILGTLLGGFVAFGLIIIEDKFRKPVIIFEVGSSTVDENSILKRKWKFIHIKIKNSNRKYRRIPIGTSTAFASKARISVLDNGTKKEYPARWTSKGEPIIYGEGNKIIGVDVNSVLVTPREDIQPFDISSNDEAVEVAIGIKYEGDNQFYAFNNESYLYQPTLANTKYEFGTGVFNGEIILETMGYKYTKKFKVHNTSKLHKDFWLEIKE